MRVKVRVVFVEPESPGNIGALARVMANFGLRELVLVNPCKLNDEARVRAVHAWPIIAKAKKMSFDQAVKGFDNVIGSTARVFSDADTTRAYVTPRELAARLKETRGKYCVVLGREPSGLTNKELRKCDLVVHVPTSKSYRSMNITHAAAVIFYELFAGKSNPVRTANERDKRDLLMLFEKLAYSLDLRNPENAVKQFRNVISRSFISGSEAKGIAGVVSKAYSALKRKKHRNV